MKFNRVLIYWLAVIMVTGLVGCGQQEAGGPPQGESYNLSIATAGMGGAYYPQGVAMAELINEFVPNAEASAEITGGALENPGLVDSGESDIGITNAHLAYFALNGIDVFAGQEMPNLSLLFSNLSIGVFQVVVLENSDIATMADLKGKRVAVGPQGGTALAIMPAILEANGLTMEDIQPTYVSYDEGMDALAAGTVDAALAQAAVPTPAVTKIATTHDVRVLSFVDEAAREKLLQDYSFFVPYDITRDHYGTEEAGTVGVPNVVIIRKDLPDELVYDITKAIFENLTRLHDAHASSKWLSRENAAQEVIPIHPGALKYYQENGMM